LIANTHGADAPGECLTIDLISIAQQYLGAWSHPQPAVSWPAIHSAVGYAIMGSRRCCITSRNHLSADLRRAKNGFAGIAVFDPILRQSRAHGRVSAQLAHRHRA
jgi:hypothetical protein